MSLRSVVLVSAISAALLVPALHSASLYWNRVSVKTSSEAACMSMAHAVATRNGLSNIRRSRLEVAGSTPKAYVAITCIETKQRAMAVVMATSDIAAEARAISDKMSREIAALTPID